MTLAKNPAKTPAKNPANPLARRAGVMGVFTMASRVLGFGRDLALAALLGTGAAGEAFVIAFRIPSLFRRTFGEGAFAQAFLPLYARRLESNPAGAARFANEALALLAPFVMALTALAIVGAPWLTELFAAGFDPGSERARLAVELTRIALPALPALALNALLGAVLATRHRFAAFAAGPALTNLILLATAGLVAAARPQDAAAVLALAATLGACAQLVLTALAAKRADCAPALPAPRWNASMAALAKAMPAPLLAGLSAQINALVAARVASSQPGALAWLYYVDRLIHLPVGVVGVSLATALLPALARAKARRTIADARRGLNVGLLIGVGLAAPAAAGLMAAPEAIMETLFGRGAYTPQDVAASAGALRAAAWGVPAWIAAAAFASALHAWGARRLALFAALAAVLFNLALAYWGFAQWGAAGLAAVGAGAAWCQCVAGACFAYRVGVWRPTLGVSARMAGLVLAAAAMGGAIWWLAGVLAPVFTREVGEGMRLAALALLVGAGVLVYGAAGLVLGALRWRELRGSLATLRTSARTH